MLSIAGRESAATGDYLLPPPKRYEFVLGWYMIVFGPNTIYGVA